MTDANEKNVAAAHDRVAMLSLKADGTPDQVAPEIVGDKEFAVEAAKRQFAEQAVSASDDARRAAATDADVTKIEQDPAIAATQKEHEKVATAAEKTAASVIDGLYRGDTAPKRAQA